MAQIKVKEAFIGSNTNTKTLGNITISQKYADLLAREGRYELLEGISTAKKLTPISEKTIKELRELAKDLPGYHLKLDREKLISLLNDNSSQK